MTEPYTLPMPARIGETQHQAGDVVHLEPDQIQRIEACYAEQAPFAPPTPAAAAAPTED